MSIPVPVHTGAKLFFFLLAAAVWLTGASGTIFATTFDFSYSFPLQGGGVETPGVVPYDDPPAATVSASGTMTGDLVAGEDYYLITGITGTWNWDGTVAAITGMTSPGGYDENDNILYFGNPPLLDLGGISFTVAGAGDDGSGNVNVYYDTEDIVDAADLMYSEDAEGVGHGPFNVSSTVPEPSTIILLGIGLAGIAARKFRR